MFVGLLDAAAPAGDTSQPELLFRAVDSLIDALRASLDFNAPVVVCGCGGGTALGEVLPALLAHAPWLVLDADALNAIARDVQAGNALLQARAVRGWATVLTPHPLEAARLLSRSTAQIQANRLAAAQQLVDHFGCVVLLKGSGTVIAAPGELTVLNPTGTARLATASTGDVLAGMVGAGLAASRSAFDAACAAVYRHGLMADEWPNGVALTAGALALAWAV